MLVSLNTIKNKNINNNGINGGNNLIFKNFGHENNFFF